LSGRRHRLALHLAALLAAALLAACAADRPDPTPLESYEPKIAGQQVWELQLSGFNFPLVPAVRDGVFFVADNRGDVLAVQAEDGAVRWRTSLGEDLSAGVGSDGRYVSVVTRGNEVVVLDNGRELWRKRVASNVVTPPLVAGERVFVMGVDRAVHAFDVLDGRRLWTLQRPGDALTLAQASVVAPFGNSLLVAQGARLAAVDPLQGQLQWEVPMATPRGTNEVERLADLVGPQVRVGDRVCARSFQSAVACADARRGTLLWSRNAGGGNAVGADADRVYGADASDRITAWRADNGDVAWTSERMLYRGLSGAVAAGPVVVFGDSEGWVHFLSTADGEPQLRLPTNSSGVVGTPTLSGSTMLVATRNGGLYAFRPQ
jgi:outer membrane protein assembly factor BamB